MPGLRSAGLSPHWRHLSTDAARHQGQATCLAPEGPQHQGAALLEMGHMRPSGSDGLPQAIPHLVQPGFPLLQGAGPGELTVLPQTWTLP